MKTSIPLHTLYQSGQRGFSMIEILVTVVVLAVGLLGIAGLQFMSKRSNFEAVQRTTAVFLANDIVERMRANPKALKTYAGTATTSNPPLTGTTLTLPNPNCGTTSCDPADLATYDLYQWEQAIIGATETTGSGATLANTGGLVAPTACITTTVPDPEDEGSGQYTVVIAWRGSTEMSDPLNPETPIPAVDPYACGRNTGALGAGKYDSVTTRNTHRRILVISTYIGAPKDD